MLFFSLVAGNRLKSEIVFRRGKEEFRRTGLLEPILSQWPTQAFLSLSSATPNRLKAQFAAKPPPSHMNHIDMHIKIIYIFVTQLSSRLFWGALLFEALSNFTPTLAAHSIGLRQIHTIIKITTGYATYF